MQRVLNVIFYRKWQEAPTFPNCIKTMPPLLFLQCCYAILLIAILGMRKRNLKQPVTIFLHNILQQFLSIVIDLLENMVYVLAFLFLWISLVITPNTQSKILSNLKEKLFYTWCVTFRINLLLLHAVTMPYWLSLLPVTYAWLKDRIGPTLNTGATLQQLISYAYVTYFSYQPKYRQV